MIAHLGFWIEVSPVYGKRGVAQLWDDEDKGGKGDKGDKEEEKQVKISNHSTSMQCKERIHLSDQPLFVQCLV